MTPPAAKRRLFRILDTVWAPCLALVLVYPLLVPVENLIFRYSEISLGTQLTYIFIYAILALGLNVVVGYTGLLHLGIAAFFGIGAYITGILTVAAYPFQIGFWPALVALDSRRGAVGIVSRRADAAAAGRLPGDRHAGLRRSGAVHAAQPGGNHGRHARAESRAASRGARLAGRALWGGRRRHPTSRSTIGCFTT